MVSMSSTGQDVAKGDKTKSTMKKAYLWNTAGSMINAFQSVFILMVLTRVCDTATAGVFTLAYANANLFHFVGYFNMRSYEASDVLPENGFRAYLNSRIITSLAMIGLSWGYLAFSAIQVGYSTDKILAVALMTLFKCVDVVEDVFDGNFQQQGRLDVAGFQLTVRLATSTVLFCIAIVLTKSLVFAIALSTTWSIVFLTINLIRIHKTYGFPVWHLEAPNQKVLPLLIACLAPFLASFLLYYIGNAPKWVIDAVMSDVDQAKYGFIAMPVFVVNLLSRFIYVPLLQPLSKWWDSGEYNKFTHVFVRQIGLIVLITGVCVAGAALIGVPVLGLLYNTDLSMFRLELCILVLGGGFLALLNLFQMGIIVMRKQQQLVLGYVLVAVVVWLISTPIIRAWGIFGASMLYISSMVLLSLWFAILFWRDVRQGVR